MDLTLVIEDEYTFFAEDKPLVSESNIIMKSRLNDFYLETDVIGGILNLTEISEGLYEFEVNSPGHQSYKAVRLVELGLQNNRFYIFLKRSTVTYRWSVKKVQFED